MLPLKTEVLATTSPIPPWQKSEDLSPRKGQGRAPDARAPPPPPPSESVSLPQAAP